ncbi:uncharacterized protein A4U43_C10F14910 [Asparagus officinalis]|uniref:Uncharacterized protein n=1 Tax=Asparagus officinalis TaxID=4686 RepID=A0A5P1E318_ASPOF|nr:uncharacterized protein A4U43_C10F14910 [Asparagus officinalis]
MQKGIRDTVTDTKLLVCFHLSQRNAKRYIIHALEQLAYLECFIVVEINKGSKVKYELDKASGLIKMMMKISIYPEFFCCISCPASLLHPCKVAFLCRGVEIPPGLSSFVCRRVYDIANKCLWWLTYKYYINEQHEEVDHLLDKTRLEMHAAVQSGDCSPKPLNGPTSTQKLKLDTQSRQNSSISFPAQVKEKKRKRGVMREQNLLSEKVLLSWRMVNLTVLDSTKWQNLRL